MASSSSAPETALDCMRAVSSYVTKMLRPRDKERAREVSGVKVLLLDKETKVMLSMVVGMNEILARDVFLVELLDAPHPGMKHIKALVLVRPTEENVRLLRTALAAPGGPDFAEYHLFFTNVVPGDALRRLADADKTGAVHQVQEYYADYYAVAPDAFSLSLTSSLALSRPRASYSTHEEAAMKRAQQGLLALLLSLKVRPLIRYQASSDAASKLALELTGSISGERELFTFSKTGSQTLLVRAPRPPLSRRARRRRRCPATAMPCLPPLRSSSSTGARTR
jgi:vacuolar protein sorting-associated protein 45